MTKENNSKLRLVWSSTSLLVLRAVTIPVTNWEEKNGSPALSAAQEPSSSQNMCLSLSSHREVCYSLQIITNDWFEILDSSELLPNEQKTVLLGVLVAFSQPFNVILMVCVCVRIHSKFIMKTHLPQGWHQQKPEAAQGIVGHDICFSEHNSGIPHPCSLIGG